MTNNSCHVRGHISRPMWDLSLASRGCETPNHDFITNRRWCGCYVTPHLHARKWTAKTVIGCTRKFDAAHEWAKKRSIKRLIKLPHKTLEQTHRDLWTMTRDFLSPPVPHPAAKGALNLPPIHSIYRQHHHHHKEPKREICERICIHQAEWNLWPLHQQKRKAIKGIGETKAAVKRNKSWQRPINGPKARPLLSMNTLLPIYYVKLLRYYVLLGA